MDVWVLVRESGIYSDYTLEIIAVASSAAEAMRIGDKMHRCEHDEEGADGDDSPGVFEPLTWAEHPRRSGDWRTPVDIAAEPWKARYCAIRTLLDGLVPDERYFESRRPGW